MWSLSDIWDIQEINTEIIIYLEMTSMGNSTYRICTHNYIWKMYNLKCMYKGNRKYKNDVFLKKDKKRSTIKNGERRNWLKK